MTSSIYTKKAAVATYLLDNVGEWVNGTGLSDFGGAAATRRVRELRQAGWNIKVRRSPEAATQFQYRLVRRPSKALIAQAVAA